MIRFMHIELRPKIMIHVDHGGDIQKTKTFFGKLLTYDIPFDVIGLSFYPWSHGTIIDLKETLTFIESCMC